VAKSAKSLRQPGANADFLNDSAAQPGGMGIVVPIRSRFGGALTSRAKFQGKSGQKCLTPIDGAQGWGGLYIRANKLAWKQLQKYPGLGIANKFAREHRTGRQNSGIRPPKLPWDDGHETTLKALRKATPAVQECVKSAHPKGVYTYWCDQYRNPAPEPVPLKNQLAQAAEPSHGVVMAKIAFRVYLRPEG
jgi:hypothetical protein